jgi:hypothetical protein
LATAVKKQFWGHVSLKSIPAHCLFYGPDDKMGFAFHGQVYLDLAKSQG